MESIDLKRQLKILIVGLGSVGLRHLKNLRKLGFHRLGVFRSKNRPPHQPVDLSDVNIHTDFKEALAQCYDAAVICNPTALHLEYALRAAEAGCHLYIEKPVSADYSDFYLIA